MSDNVFKEVLSDAKSAKKKYFGDEVDFYADSEKLNSKPSTLIKLLENGEVKILRQGAVKL